MSQLDVHSDAPAVRRALAALVSAAGHPPVSGADTLLTTEEGQLVLRRSGNVLQRWALPVRPATIARALGTALASTGTPALQNGWQFDATARQLQRAEQSVTLTEKETLLLARLLESHPGARPREQLLKEVWGLGSDVETHTLETHIYRLRSKLGELAPRPCDIVTEEGTYRLVLENIA